MNRRRRERLRLALHWAAREETQGSEFLSLGHKTGVLETSDESALALDTGVGNPAHFVTAKKAPLPTSPLFNQRNHILGIDYIDECVPDVTTILKVDR